MSESQPSKMETMLMRFGTAGALTSVHLPIDRETNRPRGFAFVEFEERGQAEAALLRFNGQLFKGRPLAINEARAKGEAPPPRPAGGFSSRPGGPRPGGFSSSRFGAPPPEDETRNRNFGPDAPPRNKRKVVKVERSDKSPRALPKERGGGMYYGHFATEAWDDDLDDLKDIETFASPEEPEEPEENDETSASPEEPGKDNETVGSPEEPGKDDKS